MPKEKAIECLIHLHSYFLQTTFRISDKQTEGPKCLQTKIDFRFYIHFEKVSKTNILLFKRLYDDPSLVTNHSSPISNMKL